MSKLKHMLYTDGHGEIAIIFPDVKSTKAVSGKIINKKNEMEYILDKVYLSRDPDHFNNYWHIHVTKTMMDSIEATHKYDLICEIKK